MTVDLRGMRLVVGTVATICLQCIIITECVVSFPRAGFLFGVAKAGFVHLCA